MRRKWQFCELTRVILVLALIACSFSVGCSGPRAAQTVQKEPEPKTISFGSSPEEVKEKLKCESRVVSGYKPVGAMQSIRCFGMVLRFDHWRLELMGYREGFDFSIPISPFENPDLNPPQGIKIFTGMTFSSFLEVVELWKSHLTSLGFQEKQKGKKGVPLKRKQFTFKCSFERVKKLRLSQYHESRGCTFNIGPTAKWFFEFRYPTSMSELRRRKLYPKQERIIDSFSATDLRYSSHWVPEFLGR